MRKYLPALVIAGALGLQGCTGVGLTLFGVGTGTASSVGVNHTLSGIAYKTFTAPMPNVDKATNDALAFMAMKVRSHGPIEKGRAYVVDLGDRTADIELERLTANATRMRVTVKEDNGFFRDSATATEIIIQTAAKLDSQLAARSEDK